MNLWQDPRVQLIAALVISTLLTLYVVRRVLGRTVARLRRFGPSDDRHLVAEALRAAWPPISFLICYYVAYAAAYVIATSEWVNESDWTDAALRHLGVLGLFIGVVWMFYAAAHCMDVHLREAASRSRNRWADITLPLFGTALRVTVPIIAIFLFLQLWPIPDALIVVTRKLLAIALIGAIAWTLRRAVILIDGSVLGQGVVDPSFDKRGLYTRVRMLRRLALVIIAVLAFGTMLMLFQEVRSVGRSILASAGIAGIVLGIAAQRSLGNLLAGIQIALTQPIRLGDQVLVEGDVGNVEEITLTYVVVRVWDLRRIILPISYFIEKPFQNWTRVQTNMLSPLVFRVDYSLPVDELRSYLQGEITQSTFWDKKVFGVQVTNADDRSMEVRVLASAPDSGASFNLQCELREKAIAWIQQHHPECLPRGRQVYIPTLANVTGPAVDRADHPLVTRAQVHPPTPQR